MNMHKTENFILPNALMDIVVTMFSFAMAYLITHARLNVEYKNWYVALLISFCVVFFLFMTMFRMYNSSTFFYTDRVIKYTTLSFVLTTALVFTILFIAYNTTFSRLFLLVFIIMNLVFLNFTKVLLLYINKRIGNSLKVIYVGEPNMYEKFKRYVNLSGFNSDIIGYIQTNSEIINGLNRLGYLKDFEIILKNNPCDYVVFTQSLSEKTHLLPYLEILTEMGISSRVILDVHHMNSARWYLSSLGTFPMITYHNVTLDPFALFAKRLIDILGAIVGIIMFFPVMAITALAIKMDSPGPVLFSQVRVGRNGRKFTMYKFRSMYVGAEKRKAELIAQNEMGDTRLFKIKDDPRITKVGKFIRKTSIDELPQFFNVFIGNMSLVGTRPPTVDEVEKYELNHYRRISIKPGITGIWQSSGRNMVKDFNKIVAMDIEYIEKWSLLLDIKLLLKTVCMLLNPKGAY